MKRKFYLFALCLSWAYALQTQAANVTPQAGVYYNIIQTPSNMVVGSVDLQPVVQTGTNALNQAFEFIPVEDKADTYYIKSFFGKYLNKVASSGWNMTYLTEPDPTNVLNAEWVITDDASATTVFRLLLNANSKYIATDAITSDSYLFCDKAVDNERGIFTLAEATIPTELVAAYNSLSISGDLTAVTSDITLATVSGSFPIEWSSSLPAVITTDGKVSRPDQYDAVVKLTATMSQTLNEITYTLTKEFLVTVKAFNVAGEQLAKWDFASNHISEINGYITAKDSISGFVGTIMNEASIRTIGNTERFNVLDLGNGKGYFDMGTEIGKAIYSLADYSICGYFRIDDTYDELNSDGNFFWNFSNSDNVTTDKNGYIIGSLKNQSHSITTNYWNNGNQEIGVYTNATKGGWHHIAYTQYGTIGTVYVDGVNMATGTITNFPSTSLLVAGRTGTLYNWLGRSCYPWDAYLRNTLLYDFQLFRVPLTEDDINFGFEVPGTIDRLNVAYTENPNVVLPELTTEMNNLSLGDLSAVTSNITLPTNGAIDPTVSISWKSSNDRLIDATGVVTRPDYFNYPDSLYATLSKNGQKVFKSFGATVIANEGTAFTNSNLVKFDFATVSDSLVTDAAEKHFVGTLKNGASIVTIGTSDTGMYKVLNLGDSIGYFDMGTDLGKIMYNLNDFTISAYYRINTAYPTTELAKNGNFLWSFSNDSNILTSATGYLIASLKDQSATISSGNWNNEQSVTFASQALEDSWHHIAYTQSGTVGTLYIDGNALTTGDVTKLPSSALVQPGKVGTDYNWLGRSCYDGDVYLRNTLVYDFRIYNQALTDVDIQTDVLNVVAKIPELDEAYLAASALKSIYASPYIISASANGIKLSGVTLADKVSLFDIAGRQIKVSDPSNIKVNTGVYILRINGYVSKVVVK
jgi:hypothetical protein